MNWIIHGRIGLFTVLAANLAANAQASTGYKNRSIQKSFDHWLRLVEQRDRCDKGTGVMVKRYGQAVSRAIEGDASYCKLLLKHSNIERACGFS
ncbi:hypothetical protein AB6D20_028055 (plasmid) [Vibrio splendidus]